MNDISKKRKLHEAIEEVLKNSNKPLSPGEIADTINQLNLYSRKDGRAVPRSQISARVNNYSGLFKLHEGLVDLQNR